MLELLHPNYAGLSCSTCEQFLQVDGVVQRRPWPAGPPVPRPKGVITPCYKCPKVPRDAPVRSRRYAQELTPRNRRALKHYRECRAVGMFPDDPLVRRHAALIREIEDAVEASRQETLITLLGGKLARGD